MNRSKKKSCERCSFDGCWDEDRYCIKCGSKLDSAAMDQPTQPAHELLDAGRVLCKLGEICYRKGEHAQAALYWKKALEIEPGNESARNMLEEVEAELARRD